MLSNFVCLFVKGNAELFRWTSADLQSFSFCDAAKVLASLWNSTNNFVSKGSCCDCVETLRRQTRSHSGRQPSREENWGAGWVFGGRAWVGWGVSLRRPAPSGRACDLRDLALPAIVAACHGPKVIFGVVPPR